MSRLIDNLRKTRALLADPKNWIQGVSKTLDVETGVVRYCLMGAAWEACLNGERDVCYGEVQSALYDAVTSEEQSPFDFNDDIGRKHGEILALLDEAIEAARQPA